MKIWTISASKVQGLDSYTAYCDEDPIELLYSPEYESVLDEILASLFDSFAYLDEDYPDDFDDWDAEEQDEYRQEFYYNWVEEVSFDAYEVEEPEDFEVIIDKRNE